MTALPAVRVAIFDERAAVAAWPVSSFFFRFECDGRRRLGLFGSDDFFANGLARFTKRCARLAQRRARLAQRRRRLAQRRGGFATGCRRDLLSRLIRYHVE